MAKYSLLRQRYRNHESLTKLMEAIRSVPDMIEHLKVQASKQIREVFSLAHEAILDVYPNVRVESSSELLILVDQVVIVRASTLYGKIYVQRLDIQHPEYVFVKSNISLLEAVEQGIEAHFMNKEIV